MKISYRAQTCTAEGAFEILAKANALEREKGIKVIHLEIGEPDFATPKNIREACKKAIDEGYTHYTPAKGIPELRQAVAEHISRTRGIDVDPENVLISAGGKLLIYAACTVFLEEGDEAIYPDPGYPPYRSAIALAGGKPVPLMLSEEDDYKIDTNQLTALITPRTRLIILNSPHNPIGSILSKTDLLQISEIVRNSNAVVFSDEIYSQLIYSGEPHITIASMPGMRDRTILMDGMSKTFAMTGWRLAYASIPTEYYITLQKIISNTVSCATTFVQVAGIEALKGEQMEVKQMYNEFKERRELIVKLVNEIPGMHAKMPAGAFYIFVNVKEILQKYDLTSKSLADHLLYEAGVACLGGSSFGEAGEGYIRFSYANSKENIIEAMKRIKETLNNNYKV